MKKRYIDYSFAYKSQILIDKVNDIIEEYSKLGYVLTLRQIYYQFVANKVMPNSKASYKTLTTLVTRAREAGLLSWTAIEDTSRSFRSYGFTEEISDLVEDLRNRIFFDHWNRQDTYIEIWGDGTSVGISGGSPSYTPQAYTLYQNYPNPFNPATKIEYSVQQAGHVTIKVYNLRGEIVRTLVDEQRSMGEYAAVWDGKNDRGSGVASGQYFYQLSVGNFVTSKKLLLLK